MSAHNGDNALIHRGFSMQGVLVSGSIMSPLCISIIGPYVLRNWNNTRQGFWTDEGVSSISQLGVAHSGTFFIFCAALHACFGSNSLVVVLGNLNLGQI